MGAGHVNISYTSADTIEYGDTEFLMRWTKDPLAAGYSIIVESLNAHRPVGGDLNPQFNWFSWIVANTEDSLRIPWLALGWTGDYRVRIISCDPALWDYMWTYSPTSVENYPVSNVQGGLGVFAIGDADTAYFVMTDSI